MFKLENQGWPFSPLLSACLFSFVFFLSVAPSAAESVSLTTENLQASDNPIVSTHDGLVSVKATEASLKNVIEQIGQALGIEVELQIGDEEKVTAEFQDLFLGQAIRRLSDNYAYTSDDAQITKLYIYTTGEAVSADHIVAEKKANEVCHPASTGELFKFDIYPEELMRQVKSST